ncbi:MAG: hypothetical protein R2708_09655 [Vicinamibacterales bacterium]
MTPARRPLPRVAAGLLGAWAGATLWVSYGVVGVTDAASLTRIGVAPPVGWLLALAAAGTAAGLARRWSRDDAVPLALLLLPWLPWLPVRVPPAMLMWDGPLEGAVWAVVLAAVTRRLVPPRLVAAVAWLGAAGRGPALAAALSAAVLLAAWTSLDGRVPSGDEPHYLVIAQSLLADGDLRIENNHRDHQYLEYFGGLLRPDFMRRGTDGQIYSIHAPGTSLVVLPAFALAGYPGAVITVVCLAALGVAAVWQAGFVLTASAAAAWAGALALIAASPFVLLGFTIYPDPIGSAIVAAGLLALVVLDRGRLLPSAMWIAMGAALAGLPWLHTRFAVIAAAFGAVLGLRALSGTGGWRDLARLLAVPIVSAVAWLGYFWVIYGVPDPSAPYGDDPGAGLSFVPAGVAGLLADQQFGLVANAPVLGAGVLGLVWLARRRPRLGVECAALFLPYLLVAAAYPMWWGGASSPARFLVVVTPVLAVPVAWLWARGGPVVRGGVAAAWCVAVAATLSMALVDHGGLVYNGRDGHALLLDWASRTVDLTLAAPSVHRRGAGPATLDAILWVVAAGLATAAALAAGRARRWVAWLGAPLVVMGAATGVWARAARPPLTAPASQARLLAAWRGGLLPTALQVSPLRRLEVRAVPGRLLLATTVRGEAPRGPAPLLQLRDVPAGDYDVFIEAAGAPAGTVTVGVGRLGRVDLPLEQWRLEGRHRGFGGLALHLAADAGALTLVGDDDARRTVARLTLRPRAVDPTGRRPRARRAARYGPSQVFALDDHVYLEPGALWTEGGQTARLVVRPDDGVGPVVEMRAGPIANDIDLRAGAWSRQVHLEAGASAELRLPPEALAPGVLEITTRAGFRPARQGGSDDVRWLGAYLTWPGAPAAP